MYTIENQPVAQGDMLIRKVDNLPDNLLKENAVDGAFILTHSETGHNHVVKEQSGVTFYQHANDNMTAYLVVDNDDTFVEHLRSNDTHAPLKFSKGIFEIRRQIESSPEGFRRAID